MSRIKLAVSGRTVFQSENQKCFRRGGAQVRSPFRNLIGTLALAVVLYGIGCPNATAFDVITVPTDVDALDITESVNIQPDFGTQFQVSTAPGSDGIIRRVEVGSEDGLNDDWAFFALANPTDEQIQRLLVVPHYRLVNSGILMPDLGSERIVSILASQGISPEREYNPEADVFLITLEPGAVITFVAELTTPNLPRTFLWKPESFSENASSFTLYQGMILGISGLLAIFLTIIFVIRGSILFPSAAALAWSVFLYCCVDFGIWSKVLGLAPAGEPYYRAVSELLLAGSFLLINFAYLSQSHWRIKVRYMLLSITVFLIVLFGFALANPSIAAGIARISLAAVGVCGAIAILVCAVMRRDRSILLMPTWVLLLFWQFGAMMAATGQLDNEIVQPALSGGLVMIVFLIGFSVMQHAFSGASAVEDVVADLDRRALALVGSGDIIWDWDVESDTITSDLKLEELLKLRPGTLQGSRNDWLETVHPEDREQFLAMLGTVEEQQKGRIVKTIRFRENSGDYRSFLIKAKPVLGPDANIVRCIGTMQDITELKVNESRLMKDMIFDELTGLPNQNLFLDRLRTALTRTVAEGLSSPAVFIFNFDNFDEFVQMHGAQIADTILLTASRRLNRLLKPQDCLARLPGEKFAVMMLSGNSASQAEEFAEILRKSLSSPINFGDLRTTFTCCVGIVVSDSQTTTAEDLMNCAEIALQHSKNTGNDTLTVYKPDLVENGAFRRLTEKDLKKAISNGELKVFYLPIMNIETGFVAGFESMLRWQHPISGFISNSEFVSMVIQFNLVQEITRHYLDETTKQLEQWQRRIKGGKPLFMTVNTMSRHFVGHDLIGEIKTVLAGRSISPKTFKLGLSESMITRNPIFYIRLLERLKAMGAGLALNDFGRGYSALNYLHCIPFDMLKIDKNFMHSSGSNRSRLVLLRNIVNLANELGMDVVASGVQTNKDSSDLFQINCKLAQGSVHDPYIKVSEAEELVTKRYISSSNWQLPVSASSMV